MSDPSLALQGAIITMLKNDPGVAALIGARVYDEVPAPVPPATVTFPYITIGPCHVLGNDTEDCGDGSEVNQQIDVWTRLVGDPEAKRIAAAVRTALKSYPTLAGFDVSVVEFVDEQFLRDPDGKTRHAAMTFRYLITHTS